ncbi:hypothetical protein TIFTF001_006587 [Ficus carica]|uniref:Uncharacterized protein n=1 Tax=Ficus carica TaxID=3494 RepID=A0AA88A0U5_FICCA|nr:hypothetical protein TIFTF001_006587 [Ficus carica]
MMEVDSVGDILGGVHGLKAAVNRADRVPLKGVYGLCPVAHSLASSERALPNPPPLSFPSVS